MLSQYGSLLNSPRGTHFVSFNTASRGLRSKAYLRRNHDATSFLRRNETTVLTKSSAGAERMNPREELSLGNP